MLQIFQSTLPRVERQLSILAYSFPCQISIHAPASGATVTSVNIKLSFNISIHAPASGATVNILKQNPNKVYFNPRSREWSDGNTFLQHPLPNRISIHAPASGATDYSDASFVRRGISIHAPASGATGLKVRASTTRGFQSTLPRVERRCAFCCSSSTNAISIHAPASGATAFIDIFSFTVRLYFISSH